jgi:hypothetical protein
MLRTVLKSRARRLNGLPAEISHIWDFKPEPTYHNLISYMRRLQARETRDNEGELPRSDVMLAILTEFRVRHPLLGPNARDNTNNVELLT